MNKPVLIRLSHTRSIASEKRECSEFYAFAVNGTYCDGEFSYDDIVMIHELTGRMIAEHKEKEAADGQK